MKDDVLKNLIKAEVKRQKETLDLIPSENIVSPEILKILGSPLANKYSEGYRGARYYGGNAEIDKIEFLAQERAKKVFLRRPADRKHWHVNVQAYSGSPANMAVYFALLRPNEKIMGMSLSFGGHLTHGWKANFSGQMYTSVQYGVGRDGLLDYGAIRKMARKERPKIIVAGATAYPRIFDFRKLSAIAHEVGAYFMADVSHDAGLIAAGAYPSPFPYADVVTTTTHKTLRGPRGAIIFANRNSRIAKKNKVDIAKAIDRAIFPGLQGGPHDNQTAAIAAALFEASTAQFKTYGRQIIKNAQVLARELKRLGFTLVSDGTDNHLMVVDLTNLGISGREAQDRLEANGIVVNRNTIPYDARSPFDPSGIRVGTPSVTSRGMKEKEMVEIARLIQFVLVGRKNISPAVRKFCKKYPLPY